MLSILGGAPYIPSKKPQKQIYILPKVEKRGGNPAQGLWIPALLICLWRAPRRWDGNSIECGRQKRLPWQTVHLNWKADPERSHNDLARTLVSSYFSLQDKAFYSTYPIRIYNNPGKQITTIFISCCWKTMPKVKSFRSKFNTYRWITLAIGSL